MNKEDVIKDTQNHMEKVKQNIFNFMHVLITRSRTHDSTKLEEYELPYFEVYTPKLATTTYMSDDYKTYLKAMQPALDHHYGANSHHPEYYENGISDMSLFDLAEMLMDWKAAVERHNDGDILKSLEINIKRFNISPDLAKILTKTIKMSMPYYVSYKKIDSKEPIEIYGKDKEAIISAIQLQDDSLNAEEKDVILNLFNKTTFCRRLVDDSSQLTIEIINNSQ